MSVAGFRHYPMVVTLRVPESGRVAEPACRDAGGVFPTRRRSKRGSRGRIRKRRKRRRREEEKEDKEKEKGEGIGKEKGNGKGKGKEEEEKEEDEDGERRRRRGRRRGRREEGGGRRRLNFNLRFFVVVAFTRDRLLCFAFSHGSYSFFHLSLPFCGRVCVYVCFVLIAPPVVGVWFLFWKQRTSVFADLGFDLWLCGFFLAHAVLSPLYFACCVKVAWVLG